MQRQRRQQHRVHHFGRGVTFFRPHGRQNRAQYPVCVPGHRSHYRQPRPPHLHFHQSLRRHGNRLRCKSN